MNGHDIKTVAALLTRNYAQTVEQESQTVVTEKQRKAAFPGLVEVIREFLKNRPDLNSKEGLNDGSRDPELCYAMEKYFAQQEGYKETWSKLLKQPAWRAHVAEQAAPSQTEIFSEETIVTWARSLILWALTSLGTNQHGQLLNVVVAMTKRFILNHPKYNSHRGFKQLSNDPEFSKLARLECNAFLESLQD